MARWSLLLGYFTLDPKFWGVVLMGASVMIFFALPWLDQSPAQVDALSPGLALLAADRLGGGLRRARLFRHAAAVDRPASIVSMVGTIIYFAFFALMPWWSRMGTFKPVPDRVTFHPH